MITLTLPIYLYYLIYDSVNPGHESYYYSTKLYSMSRIYSYQPWYIDDIGMYIILK